MNILMFASDKTNKSLTEQFKLLDKENTGYLTKASFQQCLESDSSRNPLAIQILNAFFYDPTDMNPAAPSKDSIDFDHFKKVAELFVPPRFTCMEIIKRLFNPLEVMRDSEEQLKRRIMFMFRTIRNPTEEIITKPALVKLVNAIKATKDDVETLVEDMFSEAEKIMKKSAQEYIDFEEFYKICLIYDIDNHLHC